MSGGVSVLPEIRGVGAIAWDKYRETLQVMSGVLSNVENMSQEDIVGRYSFDRISLEGDGGKNDINGVDGHLFEYITGYERFHPGLEEFLGAASNERFRRMYEFIAHQFKLYFQPCYPDFGTAFSCFLKEAEDKVSIAEGHHGALVVLLSHMYVSCEIGKRSF